MPINRTLKICKVRIGGSFYVVFGSNLDNFCIIKLDFVFFAIQNAKTKERGVGVKD